jgi:hypothetical protein
VKALLITLGVLVLLVIGVDIGGRALAENRAAAAITQAAKLTTAPDVSIHGFSFLAQALPGHYSHITVVDHNLPMGKLGDVDTTIEMYNVDFPLSDALKGNTDTLTAESVDLRAAIPTAALTNAVAGTNITIQSGPGGTIELTTTLQVQGISVPVTADLTATFVNGILKLTPTKVTAAGIANGAADTLAKQLAVSLPLPELPLPVKTATVTTSGNNLLLNAHLTRVSGRDLQ